MIFSEYYSRKLKSLKLILSPDWDNLSREEKIKVYNEKIGKNPACWMCSHSYERTNPIKITRVQPYKVLVVDRDPNVEQAEAGSWLVEGTQLNNILLSCISDLGLTQQDCLFTGIIKCRCNHTKAVVAGEIGECLPYLGLELDIYGIPDYIICLGNDASGAISGSHVSVIRNLVKLNKVVLEGKEVLVISIPNPGSLLRNKALLEPLSEKLREVRKNYIRKDLV